ncbi:MAG: hypothetical protein EA385_01270 [Salinarimonadaceae bacterium]|nr:MAG: hypothetical protein EA385_01270 [Salinarimonadaceae bacterium]
MDRISKLAALSVLRATGFASLAIALSMFSLAFDPALALQVGGLGFLILAGVMELRASIYPHKRRIRESEVWIMLDDDERPPEAIARRLIVPAMQRQLREKGLWVASASAACLALSFLTTLSRVA